MEARFACRVKYRSASILYSLGASGQVPGDTMICGATRPSVQGARSFQPGLTVLQRSRSIICTQPHRTSSTASPLLVSEFHKKSSKSKQEKQAGASFALKHFWVTHVGSGSWPFQNVLPLGSKLDQGGASRFSDFPTLVILAMP